MLILPLRRANLRDLEARHRALDLQIRKIERRGVHMTPADRAHAAELKKMKLATKDELAARLRRTG